MTTIQITLPDQLAREAEEAGLLSPESFEKLLRQRLQEKNLDQLFAAVDRLGSVNDLPYISPDEIADEIALMRAQKHASKSA